MTEFTDKRIQRQFRRFCVTVLQNEVKRTYKEKKQQQKREVQFSVISEDTIELADLNGQLSKRDFIFDVHGLPVVVTGDILAHAIESLTESERELILLSYFLGLSDREIGRRYDVVHQTISRKRNKILKGLRKYFEREGIDCTDL